MALACVLVGCAGAGDAERAGRPLELAALPAVAGEAEASPGASLTRPEWLPAELPIPARAEITSISTSAACTVVWLLASADLRATAAQLATDAKAAGLQVALTSHSSGPERAVPEVLLDAFGEVQEELPVVPVVQMAGMRISTEGATGLDVQFALTGVVDGGIVMGTYDVRSPRCTA